MKKRVRFKSQLLSQRHSIGSPMISIALVALLCLVLWASVFLFFVSHSEQCRFEQSETEITVIDKRPVKAVKKDCRSLLIAATSLTAG